MNLWNTIRSAFGLKTSLDETPIEQLDSIELELNITNDKIEKAQDEFDQINNEYELKIAACDQLIKKGNESGSQNKAVLTNRLDRITDAHLDEVKVLIDQQKSLTQQKVQLESDIIAKAIRLTAELDDVQQQQVKEEIDFWSETGLVKGQEISNQAKAITIVLDELIKGGEGSKGGKVIGHTKSGRPIYDTFNHSDHKNFTPQDHANARTLHEKKAMKHYGTLHNAGAPVSRRKSAGQKHRHHMDQADAHMSAASKQIQSESDKEIEKSHEPQAIENAGKGDVIHTNSMQGHYANVIVRKTVREGENQISKILLLKRANDKIIEPGKYCLPGGHIDEGESIEQAACRELKEEANLTAPGAYMIGKAKCADGKWAFYLEAYPEHTDVALLDGESINAHWMSQEEWIEADLMYDLKDHLVAMETSEAQPIRNILKKGEQSEDPLFDLDNPFYKAEDSEKEVEMDYDEFKEEHDRLLKILESGTPEERKQEAARQRKEADKYKKKFVKATEIFEINYDDTYQEELAKAMITVNEAISEGMLNVDDIHLVKGRAAAEGEERTWGGKKYKKTGKRWIPVGGQKGEAKQDEGGEKHKVGDSVVDKKGNHGKVISANNKEIAVEHENGDVSGYTHDQVTQKKQEEPKKTHSTDQLTAHAENTSTDQLKTIVENHKDKALVDAAKRELERRKEGDDKEKAKKKDAAAKKKQVKPKEKLGVGNVIGKTKDGKDIKDSGKGEDFKNFNSKEHKEAANVHKKLGDEQTDKGDAEKASYHYLAAENHKNVSKLKEQQEEKKKQEEKL